MAKAQANEDFWNRRLELGETKRGEKEKLVTSLVMKEFEKDGETDERWWVSIETHKFFKKKTEPEETWRVVKNNTIPLDVWDEINAMVQEACADEE